MARRLEITKRLDALTAAIRRTFRSPGLDRLNDEQRAAHARWKMDCKAYAATIKDDPTALYAATIDQDGDCPKLRPDIERDLLGELAVVSGDTATIAQQKYMRMCQQ